MNVSRDLLSDGVLVLVAPLKNEIWIFDVTRVMEDQTSWVYVFHRSYEVFDSNRGS